MALRDGVFVLALFLMFVSDVVSQAAPGSVAALPPATSDLLRLISSSGELSSFSAALDSSGVALEVSENVAKQQLTVFAPSNSAFAELDPIIQSCFAREDAQKDLLKGILDFHITVGGNYSAEQLLEMKQLPTLMGMPMDLSEDGAGGIIIEGTAKILKPNFIKTVNATVHVIDDLLVSENLIGLIMTDCFGVPGSSSAPLPSAGFF